MILKERLLGYVTYRFTRARARWHRHASRPARVDCFTLSPLVEHGRSTCLTYCILSDQRCRDSFATCQHNLRECFTFITVSKLRECSNDMADIRASGPVSSSCASTITASNTNNDHQPTTQQRTYSKLSQYQLNMPIYSLLAQLPYLISVIILTLIFEHIIKRYLNTIRKIKYALRIVATNIDITYLLYVVVTNMLEVAEMKRQLEMEDQNMNMNERCFAGDWKADLAEGLRVCK